MVHLAGEGGNTNGAAMYWVHDGPLLQYLGVEPAVQKFNPALFRKQVSGCYFALHEESFSCTSCGVTSKKAHCTLRPVPVWGTVKGYEGLYTYACRRCVPDKAW